MKPTPPITETCRKLLDAKTKKLVTTLREKETAHNATYMYIRYKWMLFGALQRLINIFKCKYFWIVIFNFFTIKHGHISAFKIV